MNPKILFETDKTTVTNSTIIRDGEVYYINQIAKMEVTDDSRDVAEYKAYYESEKRGYFWGGIKSLIVAVVFFMIGSEFKFFVWVGLFTLLIAVYNFYKWKTMPEFEYPELTYTLNINFSDGSKLKLHGKKEIIDNLKNAITQALHM